MFIKNYAQKKLVKECEEIRAGNIHTFHPELSLYEKSLIYKYSSDGYSYVNSRLRANKGRNTTIFGKLLAQVLRKITNYTSIAYRKVQLTKGEQDVYKKSFRNGAPVREPSFSSTSKMKELAMLFPGNTLFIINSKTGKDIEKIAKFGFKHIHNEYEVLFLPNCTFEVLEIDEMSKNLLVITMEEI
jgi:hypothetical protein